MSRQRHRRGGKPLGQVVSFRLTESEHRRLKRFTQGELGTRATSVSALVRAAITRRPMPTTDLSLEVYRLHVAMQYTTAFSRIEAVLVETYGNYLLVPEALTTFTEQLVELRRQLHDAIDSPTTPEGPCA